MLLHAEMVISVNGPKMVHCEAICQEALCDYFKGRINPKGSAGHFVRRSENNENSDLEIVIIKILRLSLKQLSLV